MSDQAEQRLQTIIELRGELARLRTEGQVVQWCKTHGRSAPPCGARMNCDIAQGRLVDIREETQ